MTLCQNCAHPNMIMLSFHHPKGRSCNCREGTFGKICETSILKKPCKKPITVSYREVNNHESFLCNEHAQALAIIRKSFWKSVIEGGYGAQRLGASCRCQQLLNFGCQCGAFLLEKLQRGINAL